MNLKSIMNYGKEQLPKHRFGASIHYLAGRLKNYDSIVFRGLARLYRLYEKDEILSAICSLLIKGFKKDNKYFEWYNYGVKAQLRITELYEYFMYSVDENMMDPLLSRCCYILFITETE